MYLYSVIPLTYIPKQQGQYTHYFSPLLLQTGQLVEVNLLRRRVRAVVFERASIKEQKQTIKTSSYALKKIQSVLTEKPVVSKEILDIVVKTATHYYEPVGFVLSRALPAHFSNPTKPFLQELQALDCGQEKPTTKSRPVLHITAQLPTPASGLLLQPYKQTTLSQKQIRQQWIQSATQKSLVQGNRSVVFFPTYKKSAITIENENNSAYISQTQHPTIDARFVAYLRNTRHNTPLHLYDTIPRVETLYRATQHKWVVKKTKYNLAPLHIIDMQKQSISKNAIFFSAPMQESLKKTTSTDRVALFIHRRGLYSALVCKKCSYIPYCNQCSRPLIQHTNQLVCHICSQKQPVPLKCEQCGATHIKHLGGGTELVETILKKTFPHLTVARFDYDTASTQKQRAEIIDAYIQNKTNILVGTQAMLNAPNLPQFSWSGVVMLDTILNLPIHNATEQAFTILWRLRTKTKNRVLAQTYLPHLSVFSDAQKPSFEPFFKSQLALKKALYLPPFCQIIHITIHGKNEPHAMRNATIVANSLKNYTKTHNLQHIHILGPAPHYIYQQKGVYKWYIIIKYPCNTHGEARDVAIRNALLALVPPQYNIHIDL